jgi:cell division protein FtsN
MGRDYKPRADRKSAARRGSARGGTLIGLFIGLVFGVIFALGIAWYINRTPLPFMTAKSGKQAAEAPAESDKPEKSEKPAKPATAPGQPAALPGKPGDKPLEKPRFDFYKILPEGEKASTKAGTDKPAADPSVPDKLYLQLGAFLNPADADNLKAKVALMGLEASVQKIENAEKGTLHRVRVGPYLVPAEMESIRSQLAQNGISATLVKIKPKPKAVPPAPVATGAAKP